MTPQPPKQITYLLYHDAHGNPLSYTTTPQEGTAITITREQYARADYNVIVRDGAIVSKRTMRSVAVLKPSQSGTRTARTDITVIPDSDYTDVQHWALYTTEYSGRTE